MLNRITTNLKKRVVVVVGMSGGVDSSVAAYLLKLQGYEVIGLHMINWDHREELTDHHTTATKQTESILECFEKDYTDVQNVCNELNIPYHQINFVKEYWQEVFAPTLNGYDQGITPNPDILCNQHIKFNLFLNHALDQYQADYVATGHYARLERTQPNQHLSSKNKTPSSIPSIQLLPGIDPNKDQSYFLSSVTASQFTNVLFPLGNLRKTQVKNIAKISNLKSLQKSNERKESYGMCFIGKRKFSDFVHQYVTPIFGNFINIDTNEIITTHNGFASYTIGQGAKLKGMSEKWFVVNKILYQNQTMGDIYVCQGNEHPLLYKNTCSSSHFSWVNDSVPNELLKKNDVLHCECRVRYRQELVKCVVTVKSDSGVVVVDFVEPLKAVAPGQVVALYSNGVCLGGGPIDEEEDDE